MYISFCWLDEKGCRGLTIGLDKGEVDDGDEGKVEAHEDKVGLPRNLVDHDGSELDDGVVEDPVRRRRQTVGFGTDADGRNLCRVQPGDTEPANGEESVVDEDEDGRDVRRRLGAGRQTGADDEQRDGHAHGTPEHEAAATEAVDNEQGDERRNEEFSTQAASHQTRELGVKAQRVFKDGRSVVGDQVETANLLEGLRAKGDQRAPPVHLGALAEEFLDGELLAARDGVDLLDLINLGEQVDIVGGRVAEVRHDVERGGVLVVLEQPAWRLRVRKDTDDQHDTKYCLEGNGETPLEGAVLRDKPEAVVNPENQLATMSKWSKS